MSRIWLGALAALLALPAAFAPPPAVAETIILDWAPGEADDDEEYVLLLHDTETGAYWIEAYYKDGTADAWPLGNPSPDDPSSGGKGDQDMLLDLLKQKGGGGIAGPTLDQTPLGAKLTGAGKGLGPVHNPGADDAPAGQSPSSITLQDPNKIFEEAFEGAGYPTGPGFDGNGGAMGGQIADAIRRGKKGGQGGGDNNENPANHGFYDDSMPGPPELVNPAWSSLTAAEREALISFIRMVEEAEAAAAAKSAKSKR
jgi:hypothetical protein